MADSTLSGLDALAAITPANLLLYVVDLAEAEEADQSKKLLFTTLKSYTDGLYLALANTTAFGRSLIDDADAAAARATLALGTLATVNDAPSDGSQYARQNGAWAVVSGGVTSVFGRTGAVVAASGDYTAAQVTNAAAVNAVNTFTEHQNLAAGKYLQYGGSVILSNAGTRNLAVGTGAMTSNTTGDTNLALGVDALSSNLTGSNNVAIGGDALRVNITSNNLAIGYQAMFSTTNGNGNLAIGYRSLRANVGGDGNVAIGYQALLSATNPDDAVVIGNSAGQSIGDRSVAIGFEAGQTATGADCIFIGHQAGENATGNHKLYIANTNTANPLIYGEFDNGLVRVNGSSSATSAIVNTLAVNRLSTGTPAAGFGVALLFQGESSTTENQDMARLTTEWATATHASRKARGKLTAYDTAERECIRFEASGTAAMVGFLGAAAITRQAHIADPSGGATQDAEARTAINAILTTLENFGFLATS